MDRAWWWTLASRLPDGATLVISSIEMQLTCGSIAQKMGDEFRRVSARTIAIFFFLIIVRSRAVNVRLLPENV